MLRVLAAGGEGWQGGRGGVSLGSSLQGCGSPSSGRIWPAGVSVAQLQGCCTKCQVQYVRSTYLRNVACEWGECVLPDLGMYADGGCNPLCRPCLGDRSLQLPLNRLPSVRGSQLTSRFSTATGAELLVEYEVGIGGKRYCIRANAAYTR